MIIITMTREHNFFKSTKYHVVQSGDSFRTQLFFELSRDWLQENL